MSTTSESYLIGLVGDGTARSLTPALHEEEARQHGIDYLYRPIDLSVIGRSPLAIADLLAAGRDLGFNAFNITHPCKQLVIPYLDRLSAESASLQAVNTVLIRDGEFIGHNTDRSGFIDGLRTVIPDAAGDRVVQLGAGGAGSAVAVGLLTSGVFSLGIFDTDNSRSEALAVSLKKLFPGQEVRALSADALPQAASACDGIVNTTPVGMHSHPGIPIEAALIRTEHWVADIIYVPLETQLIAAARDKGCRTLDGGHMAVGQAADAFQLITGLKPDRNRMRAHFLNLVQHSAP